MKYPVLLSLVTLPFLVSSASAEVAHGVSGTHSPNAAEWIGGVSGHLTKALARPSAFGRDPRSGAVTVRFECGADGKPTNVALVRRSGSLMVNREALRAVRGLKTLHPLPAAFREGQEYTADIIFASTDEAARRLQGSLRKDAQRRAPTSRGDTRTMAVNILAVTPG
jgi:TonB family protein